MSTDEEYREAVGYLNNMTALAVSVGLVDSGVDTAALFLLRSSRQHGTAIRVSVYDRALALERSVVITEVKDLSDEEWEAFLRRRGPQGSQPIPDNVD